MLKKSVLILGGARSGKSQHAQELASQLGETVLFVATGQALDEEMAQRIAEHQENRPSSWRTVEVPLGVGAAIRRRFREERVVVLDCITLLVSNIISQCSSGDRVDAGLAKSELTREVDELVACIRNLTATFILVSNEVGLGLVPANRVGRLYRDLLGGANQEIARHADEVLMMIAGLPVVVKRS